MSLPVNLNNIPTPNSSTECRSYKSSSNHENSRFSESSPISSFQRLTLKNYNISSAEKTRSFFSEQDSNGNTPLHKAADNCDLDTMRKLITNGIDINSVNNEGLTALDIAIEKTFGSGISLLINNGADLQHTDQDANTYLMSALLTCDEAIVELFLPYLHDKQINAKNNDGETAIHVAAMVEDPNIIKLLLPYGIDLHKITVKQHTALHIAGMEDNTSVAELLIELGINIEAQNASGHTAFELALINNCEKIIELFINNNVISSDRAFMLASKHNNEFAISFLLKNTEITINNKDENGRTALHYATKPKMIKFLCGLGADLIAADKDGNTVLHLAVEKQDPKEKYPSLFASIIDCMIIKNNQHPDNKVYVDIKNNKYQTTYEVALQAKKDNVILFYIDKVIAQVSLFRQNRQGSVVSKKPDLNESKPYEAVKYKDAEQNVTVTFTNNRKHALLLACQYGNRTAVKRFLVIEPRLDIMNIYSKTNKHILKIVEEAGAYDILRLLASYQEAYPFETVEGRRKLSEKGRKTKIISQ